MAKQHTSRRVHILREEVARRIAAGEVIDRPFSVLRELLDNAIDAGATEIHASIESGGLERIRVVDNGGGMLRDDLELCYLPHATSKIDSENDLLTVRSLGFRGEALSSIATVARLEIVSSASEDGTAQRLRVEAGNLIGIEPWRAGRGTTVNVADLFYALPARRRFLKSAAAESALCRSVFVEKALAHPAITFRFMTDGNMKLFLAGEPEAPDELDPGSGRSVGESLAAGQALRKRVLDVYARELPEKFAFSIQGRGDDFRVNVILGAPAVHRRDRKLIQSYVNTRRIWEYAFVQAVEYAFSGFLPGGAYPVAFVFVDDAPHLVDFNIHPAKREARFRNRDEIHHRIVETIRAFLAEYARGEVRRSIGGSAFDRAAAGSPRAPATDGGRNTPLPDIFARETYANTPGRDTGRPTDPGRASDPGRLLDPGRQRGDDRSRGAGGAAARLRGTSSDGREWSGGRPKSAADVAFTKGLRIAPGEAPGFRYLGQVFSLFLIAELGDRLFLVDQHAGHERLIYDRLRAHRTVQPLLVPMELEVEEEEDRTLRARRDELSRIGISVEPVVDAPQLPDSGTGAAPSGVASGGVTPLRWRVTALPEALGGAGDELIDAIKSIGGFTDELEKELYARVACRSAVMDGDPVDDLAAIEILKGVFALENPRCPHGRPIWHELSRQRLFELVQRVT